MTDTQEQGKDHHHIYIYIYQNMILDIRDIQYKVNSEQLKHKK